MKTLRAFKLTNKGLVLLGLMMMVLLLASCVSGKAGDVKESSVTGGRGTTSAMEEDSQSQDHVTIHRGQTFGQVNPSIFGTFDSAKEVEVFGQALCTASKMPGDMDVREPDYDAVIHLGRESTSIHLWLEPDSKRGMFTYITDTGTGYQLTEKSTAQLKESIGQLRYTPEQAMDNGDVVFSLGGIANREIWDKFVTEVKKKNAASVQLTTYTKEGSPIFNNLEYGYQGELIRHRFDTTHDPMGMPLKSVELCKELVAAQTEQGVEYRLNGCGEGYTQESETFYVLFPFNRTIQNN
ncbi:DUF4362 domain-containing protein [Paenibacillus sp. ISL-20]|uniref:DUF4362 domain-containing protein n=1 Tax=Paenibacillus sp. ISL-20 TaxID=2819163 RepID=UPI001BE4E652|nr:DUF4362 domain-containing protein [Paenibacillus sp. ISL-20]MBT2765202.1 DUF4362 domain-containing protein [Paenibacillus sp. ISL-20]